MRTQSIIFRADGNATIGFGHISRCLAFATILIKKFRIRFAVRNPDEKTASLIAKHVDEIILIGDEFDGQSSVDVLPYISENEIVILDGYEFSSEYQKTISDHGNPLVVIDDIPNKHYYADIVFNFCGGISKAKYRKEWYTQLLTGIQFLALRPPFSVPFNRGKKSTDHLLVNMGGADPLNYTVKVLRILALVQKQPQIRVHIVIGRGYQFSYDLKTLVDANPNMKLSQDLAVEEMHRLMTECSMAILPASTVGLEYITVGGLLFLVETADNQKCLYQYLLEEGLAVPFNEFQQTVGSDQSLELHYNRCVQRQNAAIDGLAGERILKAVTDLGTSRSFDLRKATIDDMELVFDWAIDLENRKYSYSKSTIAWPDHKQWFEQKLVDQNCYYFISSGNDPVGQIRFDLDHEEGNDSYTVSYLVSKNWKGKGQGFYLLLKGIALLRSMRKVSKVVGYVMKENIASIKIFERAGFDPVDQRKYSNSCKFALNFTGYEQN